MPDDGIILNDPMAYDWAIGSQPTSTSTSTASTTIASTEARLLVFSLGTKVTGSPINATSGNVQVISMPNAADSSVSFVFRVPTDTVLSQPMTLVINGKPASAPGATNNKFKLKMRYILNNSAVTSFTSDTFTLADSTNWDKYTGTTNTIPASVLASGDEVQVEIYRDVSVTNNAAVAIYLAIAALSYVSVQ